MKKSSKATLLARVANFVAAAILTSASPAMATGQTIAVSGDSVPSDCGTPKNADLAIELNGNLIGCLAIFVEHFNCRELNGFAFTTELGREEFDGTLDGESIKFDTQYTFNATWPAGSCPEPAVEQETTGACIHYVSGEGVGGLIRFYDVIPTVGSGSTNFLYEGVVIRD